MNDAWIQTYTGRPFPVLAPHKSDVSLVDIAHALSNLCRFAGHTRSFYSVAQHSVLVSYHVPDADRLQALLHDAPEAYVVDVPRPLKHSGIIDGYKQIEATVWEAIAAHFGVASEMSAAVKIADTRALFTEQRDLMGRAPKAWADPHELMAPPNLAWTSRSPFPARIHPLEPSAAKQLFLSRFAELRSAILNPA
jgi:5'-deoxynucleotidase YfbR-like HD superfamily hydrolase